MIYRCKILMLLYIIASITGPVILMAYPPGWSDDLLISVDTVRDQSYADLDIDLRNNVWVVWDNANWFNGDVFFSKRDSLGSCLIPQTNISNNSPKSWMLKVMVDAADNVQCVWRDYSPEGYGVWYARLANDGSILIPAHLAVNGSSDIAMNNPEAVLDRFQYVHFVWDDFRDGNATVSYTKLDTLGNVIIPRLRISPAGFYASKGGVCCDSFGNVHIAYRCDSNIVGFTHRLGYTKLDRDGNIVIPHRILLSRGTQPSMVSDRAQNVHIAYMDGSGPGTSLKYIKIDQAANILVGPRTLSIYQGNDYSHMAIDSLQRLHVVWQAESSGLGPVMYTALDTSGNFLIPTMQIVYPPYLVLSASVPRIVVDHSNRLHVVWHDDRFYPAVKPFVFYKRGENVIPGIEDQKTETSNNSNIIISPNPFSNFLKMEFFNVESQSDLKIYNVVGRMIYNVQLNPFSNCITWNGRDNSNRLLPPGIYFIEMDGEIRQKVIKVR